MDKKTIALIILDGWGWGRQDESNPIYAAKPQAFRYLQENFPVASLQASGISIGLPWGEVGNSEVGHLTLGAGKIIYQYFPRIIMSIRDGTFFQNPALQSAFEHGRKNNSAVNLVGLLTTGNAHASLEHLRALLQMAEKENVSKINLHLFGDGKDMPPRTLKKLLKEIPLEKLGTVIGRYYAMDRKENWDLTEKAYECLIGEGGQKTADLEKSIDENYKRGLNEEFLPPLIVNPEKTIRENDAVIFFNFREDGIRQLGEAFMMEDFDEFPVKKFKNLRQITMTRYEESLNSLVAFPPDKIERPLGLVLSEAGKTQLRLAETYKYAHVTYFFNGYREEPFKNEYRALIPSMQIARQEDRPEMMAPAITERLLRALEERSFDFILVNYANPDAIGHTGNFQAALETVKIIDKEIGRILKVGLNSETAILITADHGNLEEISNPVTGTLESQHDPNPAPFYLVAPEFQNRRFVNWKNPLLEVTGVLSDVAPTILELWNITQPREMTGQSLLKSLI